MAGGLGLSPNSWNCLQRVGMSALPIEVRATFSVLTAYSVSVMSKVRRSSGTCWSAANEPELPCPLWPLTSIAALKDWVGVLRLSPQLVCCILLGSRVHTWAGVTGRPFCFVWPWFRLGQRELLLEQKRWGRGIKCISMFSLLWNLDPQLSIQSCKLSGVGISRGLLAS